MIKLKKKVAQVKDNLRKNKISKEKTKKKFLISVPNFLIIGFQRKQYKNTLKTNMVTLRYL
jgi:hypothetical protein